MTLAVIYVTVMCMYTNIYMHTCTLVGHDAKQVTEKGQRTLFWVVTSQRGTSTCLLFITVSLVLSLVYCWHSANIYGLFDPSTQLSHGYHGALIQMGIYNHSSVLCRKIFRITAFAWGRPAALWFLKPVSFLECVTDRF